MGDFLVWDFLTRSPFLVAAALTPRSTLFPKPIISYTNTALYLLQSVFIFLKDDSPQLADWQLSVHASLSPSQSLSVAVACGRPQSHSIRNDFGFACCRCATYYMNQCKWTSCLACVRLQTCEIGSSGLIGSFDLAHGSQDIMSERVLLIMLLFLEAAVIEDNKLFE